MKNAIILHGAPEKENYYDHNLPSESNAHWLPWLQKELLIAGIKADTPEIPLSYEPEWQVWCREVERFDIGPETMLVGHSCGGGFWLRYLSEHPELRVSKVVLVAPWLDPDHSLRKDFFAFELDPALVRRTAGITILYSDNDMESVNESMLRIRPQLTAAEWREFKGYGHFCYDDLLKAHPDSGGTAFPELISLLTDSSR